MSLACYVKAKTSALAILPASNIQIAVGIGKRTMSLCYSILVHLTRIGTSRVGPCSTYKCVCTPYSYNAMMQRVVTYTLATTLAHTPLACINYAVAYRQLSVTVILTILYTATICSVAVAHHGLTIGCNVAASG